MGYQWSSFGHPLFPAQHYMPPVNFTGEGYAGFSWPQLDLLWATAFDMRYGLFLSAPILILLFWLPGWVRNHGSVLGTRERTCIVGFAIAFFLFCSANQYGRMQFNTGVRHALPVTPFLFVLVAVVLAKLPRLLAAIVGVLGLLWSWCLSMYRDVELGRGILESPIHILTEGFKLPWLTTLERMGSPLANHYSTGVTAGFVLVIASLVITGVWWPWGTQGRSSPSTGSL